MVSTPLLFVLKYNLISIQLPQIYSVKCDLVYFSLFLLSNTFLYLYVLDQSLIFFIQSAKLYILMGDFSPFIFLGVVDMFVFVSCFSLPCLFCPFSFFILTAFYGYFRFHF